MKLYRQVYIYLLSYGINAALSFATLSLLTHYLTTYDYGIINLYSSFLIFLMPFISGGIIYPLSVEYYKRPREAYIKYFTNAQVIPLISVAIFTVLCFVFRDWLGLFLKTPGIWILIIPVTVWSIFINETAMMITRNKNKPIQFAFFSVGKNFTEIGLTILLVIGLNMAWKGRITAAALAPVILGIISIYLFYKWRLIAKTIDWKVVRQIFLFCIPFIFERLAIFVMGYSDKYFIDKLDHNGTKEVGLYGLGSQLATIIYLVVISMNSAYQPYLYKKLSEGFTGKIHKTTIWYIGACAATLLLIYLCIPFAFRFFIGKDFADAQPFAYLLCFGYFMWGIFNAFQTYLIYLQKTRIIFLISLLGMVTSFGLNMILVAKYGAKGAAITNIITYSIMTITCILFVYRLFIKRNNQTNA